MVGLGLHLEALALVVYLHFFSVPLPLLVLFTLAVALLFMSLAVSSRPVLFLYPTQVAFSFSKSFKLASTRLVNIAGQVMGSNMSSDPSTSALIAKAEAPLPKPEDIHLIACGKSRSASLDRCILEYRY